MLFRVGDFLRENKGKKIKVLSGERWLDNEIKGVTIIEAPDIARFVNGGEILLTGLYAFKDCSVESMKQSMYELGDKKISALILKKARDIENIEDKLDIIREYSIEFHVPILEVAFEVSFKDIMVQIMGNLFSEEVKQLKYFKMMHDNFESLLLSLSSEENGITKIIGMLSNLIGNPVGVFQENFVCLGTTDEAFARFSRRESRAVEFGIVSNYKYFLQTVQINDNAYNQYVICLNQILGSKVYLVVTQVNEELDSMDCIVIESAIVALQYELSKQKAITELEKKYQNDIMHNILSGKIHTPEEIGKSATLLGIKVEEKYQAIVLAAEYHEKSESEVWGIKGRNLLNESVQCFFPTTDVLNEVNRVIVILKGKVCGDREKIKTAVAQIQNNMIEHGTNVLIRAGTGKVVQSLANLKNSYREANDAFLFMDIVGDQTVHIMNFSDMGALQLLCKVKSPEALLEYIPESLQKLYQYKKGQREDLIITLQTYLDKNQNLTKTAQELYIHYKTAAYRMEKIVKITGIDFDNSEEVLAIRIGMVAYKIYKHQENL